MGFPGALVVPNLPASAGDTSVIPVGKIPWRRKWQPTLVFLPGKSHGWRSLAGYRPWGHKRVRYDLATKQQLCVSDAQIPPIYNTTEYPGICLHTGHLLMEISNRCNNVISIVLLLCSTTFLMSVKAPTTFSPTWNHPWFFTWNHPWFFQLLPYLYHHLILQVIHPTGTSNPPTSL